MLQTYAEGLNLDGFDIVHTQDCLSANAALALRDAGADRPRAAHGPPRRRLHVAVADRVPGPLDPRARPRRLRLRAVGASVSKTTSAITAGLVSNGVDPRRFRPPRDRAERALARKLAGVEGFVVLTVGGVEPRKGSITLLEGFAKLRETVPDALLVIAGGTTLFDYRAELERFAERADQLGVTEHVWRLGALESEELERLFRAADVFAFPSVKEGFGLGGAGGDRRRAAARRVRPRRLPRLPHRRRVRAADAGRRSRRPRARARAGETRTGAAHPAAGGRSRGRRHAHLGRLPRSCTSASTSTSRSRDGGDRDVPRRLLRDGHRA